MRRFFATTVLLVFALFWMACGGESGSSPNTTTNSTGTTTYPTTVSPGETQTGAAPTATPNMANTATGNRGDGPPKIKPPTSK